MNKIFFINKAINPLIFFILIGLYFSTLAHAENLTITWEARKIPGGNNNFTSDNPGRPFSCTSSTDGSTLTFDRTENPSDVTFSKDGLTVFTSNTSTTRMQNNLIAQNKLDSPFDVSTDRVTTNSNADCDDIDGLNNFSVSGGLINKQSENIDIVNNGKIFFVLDTSGRLGKFNAANPFDVDGIVFERRVTLDSSEDSVAFNRDGDKIYTLDSASDDTFITTYSLPGAFDISSNTQIHQLSYFDIGVINDEDVTEMGYDIEFSPDGSAMFLMIGNSEETNATERSKSYIYQFSLSKNFDVSTATKVGRLQMGLGFFKGRTDDQSGQPRGFTFSTDGMKLFIVEQRGGTGVDHINQFRLECPYGVVSCVSDASASVISQVELANQNISLNVSTIFKRFEWIKRNRNNEDLTSHNIDINYSNPLLKSLVSKFEPSLKNNLAALVSNTQKEERKKKSKWSSWSIVDLSMGDYEETLLDKAKGIKTKGITLGSDRKIGDNKFLGLALRYGNGSSNIRRTFQNVDLES